MGQVLELSDQLNDAELRQLAALIKNGLKVTTISDELRVKLADWIMWVEWHCGIDGHQDVGDLPLSTQLETEGCATS